jgi:Fe-S-cluster containining protein
MFMPDGTAGCRYHQLRPMNCRVFPIDERDLADRNAVMPGQPCGFYFEHGTQTKLLKSS